MTRAYLRLDPGFDERKHEYPDGAYAALVASLCLAESQPVRGRFRNLSFLRALLGKRGRWVKYLVEHGDLKPLDDGRIYLVGWDEWQEGDHTVGDRMQRVRNRRHSDVTAAVTALVTASDTGGTVNKPSDGGRNGAGSGGHSDSGGDGRPSRRPRGLAPVRNLLGSFG